MVLVDTGAFEYGLVVEELHDTVEIVVKPLGRHLKGLPIMPAPPSWATGTWP